LDILCEAGDWYALADIIMDNEMYNPKLTGKQVRE
jgi:hypothetical protein